MPGFESPTVGSIADLVDRVGLPLDGEEAAAAAQRADALASVYAALDAVPDDVVSPEAGLHPQDRYAVEPHAPDDEDLHGAWLSRFELTREGVDGPLADFDVAIKDNTCVAGAPLTNGSAAFEDVVPTTHAAVVDRLLAAGARLVGKTNMDELAFGPTSETSAFGAVENPRATGHVAGGSSSGSAAAVAAGAVDLALGSDTGGSIRIPASYCGVVGLKPTFGRVPTYGVTPLAASLDHVGPLAPDVVTIARAVAVLADPAPNRQETTPLEPPLDGDLEGLVVGVDDRFFGAPVDEDVERVVRAAIDVAAAGGATVVDVDLPASAHSRPAWWGIAPAEFAATVLTGGAGLFRRGRTEPSLARALRALGGAAGRALGDNVKAMLALGAHLLVDRRGEEYARATGVRATLTEQYDAALADVDVLAGPATPTTALELGGFERGVTPPVNWCTHQTDLTGHPAISLPAGELDGCPVGLQLVGAAHDEAGLLEAAAGFEARLG